jgi:hypothetical protein
MLSDGKVTIHNFPMLDSLIPPFSSKSKTSIRREKSIKKVIRKERKF